MKNAPPDLPMMGWYWRSVSPLLSRSPTQSRFEPFQCDRDDVGSMVLDQVVRQIMNRTPVGPIVHVWIPFDLHEIDLRQKPAALFTVEEVVDVAPADKRTLELPHREPTSHLGRTFLGTKGRPGTMPLARVRFTCATLGQVDLDTLVDPTEQDSFEGDRDGFPCDCVEQRGAEGRIRELVEQLSRLLSTTIEIRHGSPFCFQEGRIISAYLVSSFLYHKIQKKSRVACGLLIILSYHLQLAKKIINLPICHFSSILFFVMRFIPFKSPS